MACYKRFNCLVCNEELPETTTRPSYCKPCNKFVSRIRSRVLTIMNNAGVPKAWGQPCFDCGKPAKHRDHRHYSLPLNVYYVCAGCNNSRGPALDIAEMVRLEIRWETVKLRAYRGHPRAAFIEQLGA